MTEGIIIEGELEGGSLSPEQHSAIVVERAKEKGWRPLDEFEGDPADWVDAHEFVGRQKLYDRISDLKQALTKRDREHQKDLQAILKNMAKIRKQEYDKALADLETQRAAYVQDDDAQAVAAVSKKIEQVKAEALQEAAEAAVQVQQTQAGPTAEYQEWVAENQWFEKDPEMRADAISIGVGHGAANPNKSQADILKYVTDKIKKIYPDKFGTPKGTRMRADAAVESTSGATTTRPTGRKDKYTLADLPEEHQHIARTLIRRGALKHAAEKNKRSEEAEYVAQYFANATR